MNNKPGNAFPRGKHTPSEDITKNLLKLDSMSKFGLNLFSNELKHDNNHKNGTSHSILVNEESPTLLTSSSGDADRVDFCPFDYVSNDMPSLSPEHQSTELIEVFPVTENILIATSVSDDVPQRSPMLFNAEDILQSDDCSDQTSETSIELGNVSKKSLPRLSFRTGKKIKIRRPVIKSESKNDLSSVEVKFPDLKKPTESVFQKHLVDEAPIFNDNTELENKINDSLLDMLQRKVGPGNATTTDYFRNHERKIDKECLKFITIFPPNLHGKTINLMVKGKTCRSKQPLIDSELRIVTKILNNENNCMRSADEGGYRNVYYDTETDTNIRYEVKYESASEDASLRIVDPNVKSKKSKAKNGQPLGDGQKTGASDKEGYVPNSVARTRCGRISRPPRHVIRDYKRLKRLNESVKDVEDENENSGGYADYRLNEDSNVLVPAKELEKRVEDLYGPLEPNKRQFSSLSRCPTCDKVYLGYRRMAIHFQKYPDHKNEEILRRLYINARKKRLLEDTEIPSDLKIDTNTELLDSEASTLSSPNNAMSGKKSRMFRRLKMRGSKNGSIDLKELLLTCRIEEIIKYAAPVVAGVLSSWEYLVIRSKKLKKDNDTLVSSLLTELSDVLRRIGSLSRCLLTPCMGNKENRPIFKIEEKDVLQYVLGVAPGSYLITENDEWAEDASQDSNKINHIDSENKLNSPFVSQCENLSDASNEQSKSSRNETKSINTFCELPEPPVNSLSELVRDIENDLAVISNTTFTSGSMVDRESNLLYTDDSNLESNNQSRMFEDVNNVSSKNYSVPSVQLPVGSHLPKDSINANRIEPSRVDFESQSFSPSHALNFDSLVNADDDMINDFPISLPMLLDNSSDSTDCLHLLNSLKSIDNAGDTVIAELRNAISSDLPAPSQNSENNTRLFGSTPESDTSPCILDFTSIDSNFS